MTLGKSIGGGVPTRAYGMRADADGRRARRPARRAHRGGLRADRGVWEAMEWAGPAVSVPATADDVERYVATVGELLESLVA